MNGQTGKFVGDLPVDKKAYVKYLAAFFALFTSLSLLGLFLLSLII